MMKKRVTSGHENRSRLRKRIALVSLLFSLTFGLLFYRALTLHLASDPRLERLSETQYKAILPQVAPRGTIYANDGGELAVSTATISLAVRPNRVYAPGKLSRDLSKILSLPYKALYAQVTSSKKYVWIKRHLTPQEAQGVKALDDPGLEWVQESKRYYPNRELGSQILGAVGIDGNALGGLELAYEEILKGKGPPLTAFRDARGRQFEIDRSVFTKTEGPYDLWLTLNKRIQYVLETELDQACKAHQAKACTGLVMEPQTGAILAMASLPSFNANEFQEYEWSRWKNRAVTDNLEPGSLFKVILAAAALESGQVRPRDRFFCENGKMTIGRHVIHDVKPHGFLSFYEILKVSSNIGTVKVGQTIGKKRFYDMIQRLGFGVKTGVDFPGEENGFIRPVSEWKEIDFANISFGQGVQVTPLQMGRAFSIIASGGYEVRPHFVSKVTSAEGEVLWRAETRSNKILQEETVRELKRMMVAVTEKGGSGELAGIPDYSIAGKTGTAQKVKEGHYSHKHFVSSFIGFVPANEARLLVYVTIDEPMGKDYYGGLIAAPVFRRVMWSSLRELGIPPNESSVPEVQSPIVQAEVADLGRRLLGSSSPGVPDFRGLSMREVLRILEERKLPAELEGSGVATDQSPLPGTVLKKGEVCQIKFQSIP